MGTFREFPFIQQFRREEVMLMGLLGQRKEKQPFKEYSLVPP